jgi:hypothetical protein
MRDLPEFADENGRTAISLCFEPYQSFFIVFREDSAKPEITVAAGKNCPRTTVVAKLEGPWEVAFDPEFGGPENVQFDSLDDWSTRPEPGIKHYSGIGSYRSVFDCSRIADVVDRPVYLDLGEVHSIARVRLNGEDLGIVWCAPWRVEISNHVKSQGNLVEIAVANLWPNRLIGDSAMPEEERVSWTTWSPYKPESPLLPSGLIGPVQITIEDE